MAPASTLAAAAGQSADDLAARFATNFFKLNLGIFCGDNLPLFPESQPDSHPVSNWLVVLSAVTEILPVPSQQTLMQLDVATNAMYRLLWVADFLQSAGQISANQGNTLLASYNTLIAFP